jgi:hypothetical protein
MMPVGTYTLAVAAACIALAMASRPARPQSYQQPPVPEIQEGRAWLERKAAERERAFQLQQRQQAEERRDLRSERRLDADRRIERDRPGWPGR